MRTLSQAWISAPRVLMAALSLCIGPLLNEAASAQTVAVNPVKLVVEARGKDVRVGETTSVLIILQDAGNHPTAAPKDMPVDIEVHTPNTAVTRLRTTIEAGQSSKQVTFPVTGSGIVEIRAKEPELLDGGTFVNVRPQARHPYPPAPIGPLPRAPGNSALPLRYRDIHSLVARTPEAAQPESASLGIKPILTLRYAPHRAFLADGKDTATVSAFLVGDDPFTPTNVSIRLFNDRGQMNPKPPLLIRKGELTANAVLTSEEVGTVEVEYLGANLPVELQGDRKLSIPFSPAIAELNLTASLPTISLLEESDIVARCQDASKRPVTTDTNRTVSLTIDRGRGILQDKEVVILKGHSEGRTTFLPTGLGSVLLSAYTPGLLAQSKEIRVTMPLMLVSASALGALAGGLLAFLTDKNRSRWRILIGLITGFLLYLAAAFLDILPALHLGAFHPFAVFLVSAIGGWLGTGIFGLLTKRLGVGSAG